MIIVFDLDDTLYDESSYVRSSFLEVACFLSKKIKVSKDLIYLKLNETLEKNGRGNVFDVVLKHYGIFSKKEVKNCLSVYRNNIPQIKLFDEGIRCLNRLKDFRKYVVTDGNKLVQKKKIEALNLNKYFIKSLPTHNYGLDHAKPSTYVFNKILKWEKIKPSQLIYIGDNPNKDFLNLKREGFNTIRVLTGCFKDLQVQKEYEAEYIINTLDEMDPKLIQTIKIKNENREF